MTSVLLVLVAFLFLPESLGFILIYPLGFVLILVLFKGNAKLYRNELEFRAFKQTKKIRLSAITKVEIQTSKTYNLELFSQKIVMVHTKFDLYELPVENPDKWKKMIESQIQAGIN